MTEAALHRSVAAYLRTVLIAPAFFTTFPAGGGGKVRGAQLKGMGLLPGMPDLLVFHSLPDCAVRPETLVIGIELKAGKGSQSKEQRIVEDAFRANGMQYRICRSIEDVAHLLKKEGVPFMTSHFRRAA